MISQFFFFFFNQKVAANVPTADQLSVKAEAIYDYQGRSAAELTFKKGQVITNVRILEGPWWKGLLLHFFNFFYFCFLFDCSIV